MPPRPFPFLARCSAVRGRLWAGALGLALLVAPACMGAPAAREPTVPFEPQAAFRASGEAESAPRWWTSLGDAALDAHVERALAVNHDLAAAWHAFREACAVARRTGADRLPVIDLVADAEAVRASDGDDDEDASVGAAFDLEVDLWGRLEASRRADVLRASERLEAYRATAVALAADVARVWYRLMEAELQVALLDEQIQANADILSLIEPRVASQELRSVDLLRQEELLESTREQRIEAEADARILAHELAVLTGRVPGRLPAVETPTLVAPGPLPETGIPIERVRRRPDVRAARHAVLAGDQELGAALRDRYPRLRLGAAVSSADRVFEDFIGSFAAGLLAPLFDGGLRAAEIDRTRAQRDRLRSAYAQAVLTAFREVEDALVEEERQDRRIQSLERQLALSQQSSTRLRDEYLNGQGSYIEVLTALTDEQERRRELLTARRLLVEARVDLHRALAGPFVTRREGRSR